MKFLHLNTNRTFSVCFALAAFALTAWAQDQTAPQQQPQPPLTAPGTAPEPAPQSTGRTLPPPREVPSRINNGTGFSIQPLYWMTSGHLDLLPGRQNPNIEPGQLTYPTFPKKTLGVQVTVPTNRNGVFRFMYYSSKEADTAVAVKDLTLFNVIVNTGDLLPYDYSIQNFKFSYDYLTYFWKRGGQEFRVKTLFEGQRISITNALTAITVNEDGTLGQLNPINGTKSVTVPTLGIGLEHTVNSHIRWEAKGSGWALPHKSAIGDVEGSLNFRFGHFEAVLGARSLYFKTSPKGDHLNVGRIQGPYVGLRYYLKKQ